MVNQKADNGMNLNGSNHKAIEQMPAQESNNAVVEAVKRQTTIVAIARPVAVLIDF